MSKTNQTCDYQEIVLIFEVIIDDVDDIWGGSQKIDLDPATAVFFNNLQYKRPCCTRPHIQNDFSLFLEYITTFILGLR